MGIGRYSSRRGKLGSLLTGQLFGACRYDRIAGYFSSSMLEVAGEALENMADGATVRIICNSHLDALDISTAKAARAALYREWCATLPPIVPALQDRLDRLYRLLSTGRLKVRVLPDESFGLVHGKAGVVEHADGSRMSFLGSTNETKSGWELNYELIWTDDSPEAVTWVQEEFDALWQSPAAVDLADAVVQDIDRLRKRVVLPSIEEWRGQLSPDPASPVVELPVYRRDGGLWAHQKYFIKLAFDAHRDGGARFVLADQVGLGKTVELALSAKLMALWGGGKILVLTPKTLLQQWQDELWRLLAMPSAVWTGMGWVDELGGEHGDRSYSSLMRCPRRVGLVSTGLVSRVPDFAAMLASGTYECVILDEAHRARRRNLQGASANEAADPNFLLAFLRQVSKRTRSMLLATATPVQLDPIEAYDLLDALGAGSDSVVGSTLGHWRRTPRDGIRYVTGAEPAPEGLIERWEWIRDPFPPSSEHRDFAILRKALSEPTAGWLPAKAIGYLDGPNRARLEQVSSRFFQRHHPYIRSIVRRTREYLEETTDPQTNEPYLPPVGVRLHGERNGDAIELPPFLQDAYGAAESFCERIAKRPGVNSGFLRTLLLRRVGSTMVAGSRTAQRFLGPSSDAIDDDDDDRDEEPQRQSALYPLSTEEEVEIRRFLRLLGDNREEDPKARVVERILADGVEGSGAWLERGCVVFSQYLDSAQWLAARLSERFDTETVGLYAGSNASGVYTAGIFKRANREDVREGVTGGRLRLLVGTDAASEGLNLQRLGSLINLDLPWNPTRLEQRKGRIQRIGQIHDEVWVYNMRYRSSVEDRVHELLSSRLASIRAMFGQIPDTLEDVWVYVALRDEERARQVIDQVPRAHPFEMRYDRIEHVDFETCSQVLESEAQLQLLRQPW